MKKIISIFLVVVNLFICSLGFANEVTERQLNATETKDLYRLGIMVGDENGELHLQDTITRAEAAKMICVAGNIQPQVSEGQTWNFPDVSESHWAYPYICAAQGQGIIQGDENGYFNPESNITNEEMIKVIVCLLGYRMRAEETGGYPSGYTREASRLGVTTDLQLGINTPAIRNDVGIMICNALDIPLMEEIEDGECVILDGKNGMALETLRSRIENQ